MQRKTLLSALFILVFVSCIQSQTEKTRQQLDSKLKEYAAEYKFNGAVLVAQKGKIILNRGYGWKNKEENVLNDSNTIFQIGSVTKQFTSAIILRLQEQGKLSVQDKLSHYFPDYPEGEKITIEHLLTHTSGIYSYTRDQVFMRSETGKPATPEKMMALFKDKPLEFEPGTKYSYSNSGYMLLGYIIEKVTGKNYCRVVREQVFEPLNMNHSGFDFAGLKDPAKATGYFELTGDKQQPATIVDSSVSYAAGALYTTTGDLHKWDRALYTRKILSAASLQQAFTPYKNEYGYGWIIGIEDGKKNVSHNGGIFGFTSAFNRRLDDETCIIIFDNHGGNVGAVMNEIKTILDNYNQN